MPKPKPDVPTLCAELQALQRQRAVILKSRNMQATRLQAVVAGTLGYSSGLPEPERRKKFDEAAALIARVNAGEAECGFSRLIRETQIGIDAFNGYKKELEKEMIAHAARLPVAAWVAAPARRGFGLLMLAVVVGETGDLSNYPNPAKLWKRLGCAPITFGGKSLMGSTWQRGKEGKLPAEVWEAAGYSPRRRSIAYLVGEGLVKQNTLRPVGGGEARIATEVAGAPADSKHARGGEDVGVTEAGVAAPGGKKRKGKAGGGERLIVTEPATAPAGPYRARYLDAKAAFAAAHPGAKPQRCHLHAMLLATKLLLKHLWAEWTGRPDEPLRVVA